MPQSIDGEPHEVAAATIAEFLNLVNRIRQYGVGVELMVRAAMLDEALSLPKDFDVPSKDPSNYADGTYELQALIRVNRALAIAADLLGQAQAELDKPLAESRRV